MHTKHDSERLIRLGIPMSQFIPNYIKNWAFCIASWYPLVYFQIRWYAIDKYNLSQHKLNKRWQWCCLNTSKWGTARPAVLRNHCCHHLGGALPLKQPSHEHIGWATLWPVTRLRSEGALQGYISWCYPTQWYLTTLLVWWHRLPQPRYRRHHHQNTPVLLI